MVCGRGLGVGGGRGLGVAGGRGRRAGVGPAAGADRPFSRRTPAAPGGLLAPERSAGGPGAEPPVLGPGTLGVTEAQPSPRSPAIAGTAPPTRPWSGAQSLACVRGPGRRRRRQACPAATTWASGLEWGQGGPGAARLHRQRGQQLWTPATTTPEPCWAWPERPWALATECWTPTTRQEAEEVPRGAEPLGTGS